VGRRIVLFSYGSGLASAMFSLRITKDLGPKLYKLLENLSSINQDLHSRVKVPPEEFDKTMILREETHNKGQHTTGNVLLI
jgi:hydroxymethylglutaryl-CoA synthase